MPLTDPSILNPPKRVNPQFHFIYGKEKCGKTSAAVQLPDSYLCELVHEGAGADYLNYKGHAFGSLQELRDSYKQLREWNKTGKFRRLIVDSSDALVSWLEDLASAKYKTLINKENAPIVATVMELGYGKGTEMLAQMLKDELAALRTCCDELLLIGHCKKFDKTEQAVDAKEVDLPGKLRNKIVYTADAAAYCFQKDDQLWLTYRNKDEIAGGSRALHLTGQVIMLSEMKDGKLTTFWEKIYLPEPAQAKAETKQAEQKA